MLKYTFLTGKNYSQVHSFEIKPLKFKLMDFAIPILQKINELTAIDYSKFEGVTQTPQNDTDLSKYLQLVELSKNVVSRETFKEVFELQVELFKETIQFDKTTEKYKEQILNDTDFWEEQDIKELNKNLNTFRDYLK